MHADERPREVRESDDAMWAQAQHLGIPLTDEEFSSLKVVYRRLVEQLTVVRGALSDEDEPATRFAADS